jgi:hypothetical protein
MGLWVLILVASLDLAGNGCGDQTRPAAIAHEFQSQAACENAENFIRQDLEKRGMAKSEKIAGGCVRKW